MARISSPRGRRPRSIIVIASIVVVLVAVVGAALAFGGSPSQPGDASVARGGFPSPTVVPTRATRLRQIGSGRSRGWLMPVPLSAPRDVAVAADGTVWVSEQDRGAVDAFVAGTLTRHLTDGFPGAGAFEFGAGPGATIWFSGYPAGTIGRILPDGTLNVFSAQAENSVTFGVSRGSADTMWASDIARGLLMRINPDATVDEIAIPLDGGAPPQPRDVAAAPDGRIWFTDPASDIVGRLTPGNIPKVDTFPTGAGSRPRSVAVASDGTIWVTLGNTRSLAKVDPTTGSITRIPVPEADAKLNNLILAPDGTIWVSEQGAFLLHVRADGTTIERVKMPGGASYADGVALGTDGTLWAAATDANMIVAVSSSP